VVALYRLGFPEHFRPYPADRFNPAIDPRTDVVPNELENGPASSLASAPPAPAKSGPSVEAVFAEIAKRVEADPELVQKAPFFLPSRR